MNEAKVKGKAKPTNATVKRVKIVSDNKTIDEDGVEVHGNWNILTGKNGFLVGNCNDILGENWTIVGQENKVAPDIKKHTLIPAVTDGKESRKRSRGGRTTSRLLSRRLPIFESKDDFFDTELEEEQQQHTRRRHRPNRQSSTHDISHPRDDDSTPWQMLTRLPSSALLSSSNSHSHSHSHSHTHAHTGPAISSMFRFTVNAAPSPTSPANRDERVRINIPEAQREGELLSGTDRTNECNVCLQRKISTIIRPCNHVILCSNCAITIAGGAAPKCPKCSKRISEIERIVF